LVLEIELVPVVDVLTDLEFVIERVTEFDTVFEFDVNFVRLPVTDGFRVAEFV